MTEETRICRCGCGSLFETKDARKIFANKQHADRSRNAEYSQPRIITWATIDELRHFSKLDDIGRSKVLLGKTKFSVVMFDIEATHLTANVGRILCCSFKPIGKPVYTLSAQDFRRADVYDDSRLAAAIRDELERYDIIVGWNSRGFDIKYINARNLRVAQRTKKAQYHVDGLWSFKTKAAAWAGLKSVQQFIAPEAPGKTAIRWEQWMRALGWNKKLRDAAMKEIVAHCERDVIVLEEVYRVLVKNNVVRSLRVDGGIL